MVSQEINKRGRERRRSEALNLQFNFALTPFFGSVSASRFPFSLLEYMLAVVLSFPLLCHLPRSVLFLTLSLCFH